jgi:transposase
MEDVIKRACGLDVHQATVVACIQRQGYEKQIKTFGTTTAELESLKQWLKSEEISHIAMESTGIYWRPVFNVLEDEQWELLLVNAGHIKNVPGRKTDVKDCEWICKLLRAGLLRGSFIPQEEIRQLRSFTRYQKTIQHQIQGEKNSVHKLLQECNIKITQVVSDIFGVAGSKILDDLAKGTTDPKKLAKYLEADKRLALKKEQALACLKGKFTSHHQVLLKTMLDTIAFYQKQITNMDTQVDKILKAYQKEHTLLQTIPGVKAKAANHIIAELSTNMDAFPTEKQLSSWAGLCPGNNESAGKKKAQGSSTGTTTCVRY